MGTARITFSFEFYAVRRYTSCLEIRPTCSLYRQLLDTVEDLLQRSIGLKALTQDIDTTTAGGRLIFTVFGAIAEFEREIIRERTRAGLDAARLRGRKGGRPRALEHFTFK